MKDEYLDRKQTSKIWHAGITHMENSKISLLLWQQTKGKKALLFIKLLDEQGLVIQVFSALYVVGLETYCGGTGCTNV